MEGKTILLIDDDFTFTEMYRERLRLEGYHVEVARTGEEGLELAHQILPNLIILDVMMPGIGGWETLKRLKTDRATATIPVVVFTALIREAVKAKARQLGALASFGKSEVTFAELIETVKGLLGGVPFDRSL